MPKLDKKHLEELRASGISDGLVERAGIYSAADGEIARLLGWQPRDFQWGKGMVIPFSSCSGETPYCRVKLNDPRRNQDGNVIKYESPRRKNNRVYLPPGFEALVADSKMPVLITEGEKKALSAIQMGFACLGLVGVWGFALPRSRRATGRATGPRLLLPELSRIHWKDRDVHVIFDSDVVDRRELQQAERELVSLLAGCGARVHVVRLPRIGNSKTGLDDFLVHHGDAGAAELRRLMASAPLGTAEDERAVVRGPFHYADAFIAGNLVCENTPVARHWRDELYRWNGRCFRRIPAGDFHKQILGWLDLQTDQARPRLAREVVECIGARLLVAAAIDQPAWLGSASSGPSNPLDWISASNGIVDVPKVIADEQFVLLPHSPLWFSPNCLPYPYEPGATCPSWFKFLDEALEGDEQRIDLLAEFFGICMTMDTSFQKIALLVGPPRSGKGTTLRTLRCVVGTENCVSPRLASLSQTFGLESLIGKSVAICPDAHLGENKSALSVLEILKSISGEDPIEIHRKYLPSITVRLRVRFALAVNELPAFADTSNALLARLLIVPFNRSFAGVEDPGLEEKLLAESSGIFNWSMYGLRRLRQRRRFTSPVASELISAAFARVSSPVHSFVKDCCDVAANARVDRVDLFDAYTTWCKATAQRPLSRDKFGVALHAVVPHLGRSQPRKEGGRADLYTGITLLAHVAQVAQPDSYFNVGENND